MAYEMKDNTGSLWKNDRKEQDTHADYQGSVMVDGKQYWLNAWVNTSSGGKKYFGLKLKLKDGVPDPDSGSQTDDPMPGGGGNLEDEIPFAPEWRL
jgi:hypothetical protein